ncbi:MAG TPA: hypothetical protein VGJ79_06250 [Candidatus Dormibacteraeota bacterium]
MSRFRGETGEQSGIALGMLATDVGEIARQLDGYGCRVIGLFDGEAVGLGSQAMAGIDSGQRRALNRVTRTW